jgi:hypothetical protein
MTSIPPPTYYQVTMMGETYDIYSKRFEQDTDNLPGITSFWNNFKRAVATHTRSNIFAAPPDNNIHGDAPNEKELSCRILGIAYPYAPGYYANGFAMPNPPPPSFDDYKNWSIISKEITNQRYEDNKALQMLWSWIGDYRRRTLDYIYGDETIPARTRLLRIRTAHMEFLRGHTPVIIARYKAQWTMQSNPNCTSLKMAIDNLHLLQNINTSLKELDPASTFTAQELIIYLIPTLHHDNFSPLIERWNTEIGQNAYVNPNALQHQLERCFISKTSLNNASCYAHVGTNPDKMTMAASTMDLTPNRKVYSASASPSPRPHADDLDSKIAKAIDDAFRRREQRSRASPTNGSRDSSRSESPDHSDRRHNRDRYQRPRDNDSHNDKSYDSRGRDRSRSNETRRDGKSDRQPDRKDSKDASPARSESPKQNK